MSTDEHYDGEVHGLLATAFDGDVPPVNVVPAAVDGYRRHRRRARVLGTAGGALALAGVAVAGTALASGGGGSAATQSAASGARTSGGTSASAVDPDCRGIYDQFSARPHDGVYTGDSATLSRVCTRDVAALRAAIPGATVVPQRETFADALAHHEVQEGGRPPAGADAHTPLLQPGAYVVKAGGHSTYVSLIVADQQEGGFNGCLPADCPPNMKLADGTPATESPALAAPGVGALAIRPDAGHWVFFFVTAQNAPGEVLGFDFPALVRSRPFAAAVAADVHDLNRVSPSTHDASAKR
jgi:hypothetical protein